MRQDWQAPTSTDTFYCPISRSNRLRTVLCLILAMGAVLLAAALG